MVDYYKGIMKPTTVFIKGIPIPHDRDAHLVDMTSPDYAEGGTPDDADTSGVINLWSQIDKTISNIADITTKSHVSLSAVGTNTHAQIDTHIADMADPHNTTWAQVDKTTSNITDITTKSHASLSDIGTNTHAAIDTHISTVLSGTYTPTLTNVANLDASTAYVCQYMRVGSVVTVSGRVDVDPTSAATTTQLGISLPIASNLASSTECSGVAFNPSAAGDGAAILGDAANNRAEMQWVTGGLANHTVYFTFTYRII